MKIIMVATLISLTALTVVGCGQGGQTASAVGDSAHPAGWTDETHSNGAEPNYDVVFPQDKVNQLRITIDPDDWELMQANMSGLFGAPGTQSLNGQPGIGSIGLDDDLVPGDISHEGGEDPGTRVQQLISSWANMADENPMWVPATLEFNGLTWTNVGIRYKGNSSLINSWRNGSLKLPFKLDFDEFEDEYPEITDQRFYGFKQLSFSNAFKDDTYMRDAIMSDLLTESGLAAAEVAYYEVILDYGEGPVNLGLYVTVEVVDDTVIERCFGDDSGNIYEGDGSGASLARGTYNLIQNSFQKENNEEEAGLERYRRVIRGSAFGQPHLRPRGVAGKLGVDIRRRRLSGMAGYRLHHSKLG